MTHEEHQKNFKMLLNDIGRAGYDLRYKLQDMSKLGLVQKRKRLLIIAARYVKYLNAETANSPYVVEVPHYHLSLKTPMASLEVISSLSGSLTLH